MRLPTWKIEEELIKEKKLAIGIDEAGRGPLAGPVVAVASWIEPDFFSELEKKLSEKEKKVIKLIRDSKTLSSKQREESFSFIKENSYFHFGLGQCSAREIDRLNILGATLLAMRLAVDDLLESLEEKGIDISKSVLLVDGNRKIPGINYFQKTFVHGDSLVFSIALASIFAKVSRDKIMLDYHQKYPQYGFDQHKGYGTKLHYENLKKNGSCSIHRKSFRLK